MLTQGIVVRTRHVRPRLASRRLKRIDVLNRLADMAWPLASHFQASLQNPAIAFRDPLLQSCSIAKNALGQPRPWAGSFAVVYKATDREGTTRAVRVFSTESPQRRERYDCIAGYLSAHKLPCLVNFEYRDDEIRCLTDGRWYPMILMEWVEGETLLEWVEAVHRDGAGASLAKAAERWVELVGDLVEAEIAHGDLQHANVLVTPDHRLKLVDYDGMCVPALAGQENIELGVRPYQHPGRNAATLLSPRLDNFSALVIYVALRAMAADPRLWDRYVERPQHDKLLFREDDFRFPDRSPLRRDLRRSPDRQVRDLAELLFELAAGDIDRVPRLSAILAALPAPPTGSTAIPAAAAAEWPAGEEKGDRYHLPERPKDGYPGCRTNGTCPLFAARAATAGPPSSGNPRLPTWRPAWQRHARVGLQGRVRQRRKDGRGQDRLRQAGRGRTSSAPILREMDRIGHLRHPHIAALLNWGAIGKDFFFIIEYCGGGSLAERVSRRGPLPLAQAGPLMLECLDAVGYAHLHHVIHDDLKPQNILWDASAGRTVAKVTDFALARTLRLAGLAGVAPADASRSDSSFMPRERLTGNRQSRPVSDLWSLAAVFYYALSGRLPYDFGQRDPVEVILTAEPVPLGDRVEGIPAGIARVIDRALRANPAGRYQTAAEMRAGLEEALAKVCAG